MNFLPSSIPVITRNNYDSYVSLARSVYKLCIEHQSLGKADHDSNLVNREAPEPGGRGQVRTRLLSQPEVMVTMLAELATSMS